MIAPRGPLLFLLLTAALPLRAADVVATIICWHEVDEAPTHATQPRRTAETKGVSESRRYTVAPAEFRRQLDELQNGGYNVIPLSRLVAYLEGSGEPLPPRAVVLTVDDGWLCAYSDIYPELRRRNLPWTLFIYPKIVGRGAHAVKWSQVREMAANGVDIQSHSLTHPFLTATNNHAVQPESYPTFLREELETSRERISAATKKPVEAFCFPFGDHDSTVVAALAAAGYHAGLTTVRGPVTPETALLTLPRYLVHNSTTLEEFRTFLPPAAPAEENATGATVH